MMTVILFLLSFIAGVILGVYTKGVVFDSQDWRLLRWEKNCLGYRPVIFGATLHKNENIIMALQLNTDVFPSEGFEYIND